jgi:hypothetical protein
VLIPVARFKAGEWTAPWPEGDGVAPASVRLIVSDNERGQFVMLKDAAASRDRELAGALTALGTMWGLDRLAVLA